MTRPLCDRSVELALEQAPIMTLEAIALELGISKSRVERLEKKALKKLRRAFVRLGVRRSTDVALDRSEAP